MFRYSFGNRISITLNSVFRPNINKLLYWEEKSKLKPDSNLLSFKFPGGKNLGAVWVVAWTCWTGRVL